MNRFRSFLGEFRLWFCNFVVAFIPSHAVRLAYYRHFMGFAIGPGASVHLGCHFTCARHFSLGRNSTVNQYCHLDNRGGLHIGENVSISPRVAFITADHDVDEPKLEGRVRGITVCDRVFIGFGAVHLPGVRLETGCVVGAASLVTKSTEPYGVYFGVPATKRRTRPEVLEYVATYRRLFH